MARDGGVSLRTKDAMESGGFGPGPATIKRARWVEYQYPKKGQKRGEKPRGAIAPVLLVTFDRDGDSRDEPYGIGTGWRIENKGLKLTPKNGQSGIPKTCNAFYFIESLEAADVNPMPDDFLDTPDQLDGIDVVLMTKPIERSFERDGVTENTKKSLIVVEEVLDAPWVEGAKGKAKSKAKAKADADDEEEDDDDEDDKPVAKGKSKSKSKSDDDDDDTDADDDDDEDEKPTKGKAKTGAKASSKAEDDEDEDEAAVEAVCDLLADEDDAVLIVDLPTLLKKRGVKRDVIARVSEDDFLDLEKGWERKGKKIVAEK